MDDLAVKRALMRLGGRASIVDTCPVCGRPVTAAQERIRAWPGKHAHARCASYLRRGHRRRRGGESSRSRRAA
ncbi:MAG: hypothetical protein ACRDL3_05030 [Solirubrobacterales bacterium]